jgi:hypothetical protein
MMNLVIVIPIHGRIELARRIVLYYETLDVPGVSLTVLPVVDTFEEMDEFSAPVIANEDATLGEKFNFGIWSAPIQEEGLDGVMIVGSDDLISPYIFRELATQKPHYMEIGGCHFFESATGRMRFIQQFNCGAGKYFSREFLDRCDWKPYEKDATRNVDSGPRKFLREGEVTVWQSSWYTPFCIDVKTHSENMWDFEWVEKAEGSVELTANDIGICFASMNKEKPEWWRGL